MNLSANSILLIGCSFTGMLWIAGFLKKLRNDNVIKIVYLIAICIAILGLLIRSDQTKMNPGNAADYFFGPLIYILSYSLLRHFYKRKFGIEPTYNRVSWYDLEEGRRQNWFDVAVHIVPMMLSIRIPLAIG